MKAFRESIGALILSAAAALLATGCSSEAPAPIVWQPRDVAVVPSEGGRLVQALWIRNGISLLARYRPSQPVAAADLLADPQRQLVWLREGRLLQALSLPELEPLVRFELAPEGQEAELALAGDGAVVVGEARYHADRALENPTVARARPQPRG